MNLNTWCRLVAFCGIINTVIGSSSDGGGGGSVGGPVQPAPADGIAREYCQWEIFEARCQQDEVIVISKALYGRPNYGRCVRPEYGHTGCFRDVRPLADALCSGRQHCQITVPDKIFDGTPPCREDLKLHLEIGYTCIKILLPTNGQCRNPLPSAPSSSVSASATVQSVSAAVDAHISGSGVLASIVSASTGCGSPSSPWLIDVGVGQRVNITLIDFSLSTTGASGSGSDRSGNGSVPPGGTRSGSQPGLPYCQVYAIIKEQGGQQGGVTVCSSDGILSGLPSASERERSIYVSSTNAVEIRILTARSTKESIGGYFVLRYQAIGCADMELASNVWWKRDGENATAGCNGLPRVWHVTCVRNTWVGDMPSNCPDVPLPSGQALWTTTSPSMTMTFIIFIACLVGMLVFTAGLCIIHRRCNIDHHQKASYQSAASAANLRPMFSPEEPKQLDADAYNRPTMKCDGRSMYHSAVATGLHRHLSYAPTATTTASTTHYVVRTANSFDDCCNGSGAVDNEYAYVDEIYGSHGYTTCTGVVPPPPPVNNNNNGNGGRLASVSTTTGTAAILGESMLTQQQGCAETTSLQPQQPLSASGICYDYKLPVSSVDDEVSRWPRQQQQQQRHHQVNPESLPRLHQHHPRCVGGIRSDNYDR